MVGRGSWIQPKTANPAAPSPSAPGNLTTLTRLQVRSGHWTPSFQDLEDVRDMEGVCQAGVMYEVCVLFLVDIL